MNTKSNLKLYNLAEGGGKELVGLPIGTVEELRLALNNLLHRLPGIVELISPEGRRLQLGLGGPFACAQFLKEDNLPPYLMAKARRIKATRAAEFALGGTPTPVPPEQCISPEDAVHIAEHFLLTHERDPSIEWVEV